MLCLLQLSAILDVAPGGALYLLSIEMFCNSPARLSSKPRVLISPVSASIGFTNQLCGLASDFIHSALPCLFLTGEASFIRGAGAASKCRVAVREATLWRPAVSECPVSQYLCQASAGTALRRQV